MPWKMDGEQFTRVDGNPNPVWIFPDGKEEPADFERAYQKISALNEENKGFRTAKEAAEEKLKGLTVFVGEDGQPLDPTEVKKWQETFKNLSDHKLVQAAEVQRIKDEAVQAATKQYVTEINDLKTSIAEKDKQAVEREKGWAFANSVYVKDRLTYPPAHALRVFGDSFKIEDGKIVAYHGDQKVMSRKTIGEPADFEEAMEYIVSQDPQRDSYLKTQGGGGSGAEHSTGKRNNEDLSKLPPTDRLAAVWGAKPS